MDAEVIIVGAGPVGLVAALRLLNAGISVRVLERELTLSTVLKASTFHPPTLDMLATLDLAEPLLRRGLICPDWQVRHHETGARAVFDLSVLAADTAYPYRLQCEQHKLCELLLARLPPGVVAFGCTLDGIVQGEDSVTIIVTDQDQNCTALRCKFLIGADGAGSAVRKAVGLEFDGMTYPETTILATTSFAFEAVMAGLSNVNYLWCEGGTFSLLRLPAFWRCSLYAEPDEAVEAAAQPDAVQARLRRITGSEGPFDVMEIRPYRVHQRMVSDYRRHRVLLAGDAAHINSPSGGMGMNGGIHDAFNLTGKLSAILLEGQPLDLLDQYTRQRLPVAREQILAQAHRNRSRMQERDPARRAALLAELQAITADPEALHSYLLRSSMIAGLRQAAEVQ